MTRKLVNLKDNNDILVPKTFNSIDTNNLIASGQFEYIAENDCYALYSQWSNWDSSFTVYIDGVLIGNLAYIGKTNRDVNLGIFPLKAGQKIVARYGSQGYAASVKIYGIKY